MQYIRFSKNSTKIKQIKPWGYCKHMRRIIKELKVISKKKGVFDIVFIFRLVDPNLGF